MLPDHPGKMRVDFDTGLALQFRQGNIGDPRMQANNVIIRRQIALPVPESLADDTPDRGAADRQRRKALADHHTQAGSSGLVRRTGMQHEQHAAREAPTLEGVAELCRLQ